MMPNRSIPLCLATACFSIGFCEAGVVPLQMPTATFSQDGWPVGGAIDGNTGAGSGWAIAIWQPGWLVLDQTAVFETINDIAYPGGAQLEFSLHFAYGNFTLGRFRLSVTTDDRSTFADGLPVGGDVTANWTVLSPYGMSSSAGATFTKELDDTVFVSGPVGASGTDVYTINALTPLTGITGIRLEVLKDAKLPAGGPGYGNAGNFVLTELTLSAVPIPEPATSGIIAGLGLIGLGFWRRVRG